MYPNEFEILYPNSNSCTLNLITGCSYIKEHSFTLDQQFYIIEKETKQFMEIRDKYLLY